MTVAAIRTTGFSEVFSSGPPANALRIPGCQHTYSEPRQESPLTAGAPKAVSCVGKRGIHLGTRSRESVFSSFAHLQTPPKNGIIYS